ncbi:MlaA family lipoprotein [Rhodoferax aquaticus]|uniref:VacJ family lipoprotein n=1 Tax=Rhodoferax aquaticus TaxID=2527691 RepID=A0A515ELJ2_9BURK|nr:VacJ family lipoprotein [Rhodoferax aquaticus]QDL53540.1 VacJ family lipoprotein [Rhodoferax aquaticus]
MFVIGRVTSGWLRCLSLGVVIALLQGCASVPNPDARDPFESVNRGVFSFNDAVDRAVAKPVATVYKGITPFWFRKGVGNFFGNLDDVWSAFNNALQLRGQETGDSIGRVMVNTTIGLLGVVDVASDLNIDKHPSNFGLTLGRWGVAPGPYLVLPLLGPSSLRDAVGLPVDSQGSILGKVSDVQVRDTLTLVNLVDTRAAFLGAGQVVEEAALDKYSFIRDGYLQRRRNLVYDGNPPEEDEAPLGK